MTLGRTARFLIIIFIGICAGSGIAAQQPVRRLPPALFDKDPQVRVAAIGQVEGEKLTFAAGKLASMARDDSFAEVREAACRALGTLSATDQMELLKYLAINDANASVRAAAKRSLKLIRGEPIEDTISPLLPGVTADASVEDAEDDDHKKPTLKLKEPELRTRHFAIGLGSMGGYGIAALNIRGRIHTGVDGLPFVGLELGGGWTPPTGYSIISGLRDPVTDDSIRWRILSGGGGVLLFFHRYHYMPIRGGFDVGQGPYFLIGYGFEVLNEEGFFGWGGEVGILYHPVMKNWIDNLTDGQTQNTEFWPVVPYVRFVLHFYLV